MAETNGATAPAEAPLSAPDGGATWRQARQAELQDEISQLATQIDATEAERQVLTERIGDLSSQLRARQDALRELDESRQVEGNYSTSIKVQLPADRDTVAGQRLVAALASGSLIEFIAPESSAAGTVLWVEVPINSFNYSSSGHWANDFDVIDVTFPRLAKGEPLGIHLRPIRFAGEKAMVVASAPPTGAPAAGLCQPGDLVLGDHCERDVLLLQKKTGKGKMQMRRPRPVHTRACDVPTPGATTALALVGDAEPLTDPLPPPAEGGTPSRRGGSSIIGSLRRSFSGRARSNSRDDGSSGRVVEGEVDPLRYEDDPVARAHRPAGTHQLQAAMDAGDPVLLAAAIEEAQAAGVTAANLQTATEQLSILSNSPAPPPWDHDPLGHAPAPTTKGFI